MQSLSSSTDNKRGQTQRCGTHDYMKALSNWQRNLIFNRASHDGKQRHRKHFSADTVRARARCLPLVDHLLQEMNTRMLVSQVLSVHHTETTGASDTRKKSPPI